jgi:hypothetical protein
MHPGDSIYTGLTLSEHIMSAIILACHTDCSLSVILENWQCYPKEEENDRYLQLDISSPHHWEPVNHFKKEGNVVSGYPRSPTGRGWNVLDTNNLLKMKEILKVLLKNNDEEISQIVKYYKLGLRFEKNEPSNSFQNFYKVIEQELHKFSKVLKNKTNAQKLVYLADMVKLPENIDRKVISSLIKIRNSQDVAHSLPRHQQMETKELVHCKRFAHQIIYYRMGISI